MTFCARWEKEYGTTGIGCQSHGIVCGIEIEVHCEFKSVCWLGHGAVPMGFLSSFLGTETSRLELIIKTRTTNGWRSLKLFFFCHLLFYSSQTCASPVHGIAFVKVFYIKFVKSYLKKNSILFSQRRKARKIKRSKRRQINV